MSLDTDRILGKLSELLRRNPQHNVTSLLSVLSAGRHWGGALNLTEEALEAKLDEHLLTGGSIGFASCCVGAPVGPVGPPV